MNVFIDRYPGLEELIEEFEHLSLAREDKDIPAITYFKKQRRLRDGIVLSDEDDDENEYEDTLGEDSNGKY